ncbi:O-methyltransferase [Actinobacteria bacterium YIM 96077]|uniref:Methyltransferase n=1 Tax=Phytoactinopolyspora halophila TaxID=1981511 RepID=A0A329QZY5_9ACTN|nr:O-methyltransferase [Phytoactinopolyspora halophila]AYY11672.1 O-methyltransferase [Actinobacteria bacterium YIM 96077]RAW17895.1 methyltransferase [Phytoactinopolyspora halophila]
MSQTPWDDVDAYLCEHLVPSDDVLDAALKASADAGLPAIHVAPNQGKMLQLLAQLRGARSILEVGTLGGYSTIWLARALPPDGHLVTLESEPHHAEVARANIARAGFADLVDVRIGAALETLEALATEGAGPFDVVFIDADKENTPEYVRWGLKLACAGSVIVVDNVVRRGEIADESSSDPRVQGIQRALRVMADEPALDATAVQTVGSKGYDGFALAVVTA